MKIDILKKGPNVPRTSLCVWNPDGIPGDPNTDHVRFLISEFDKISPEENEDGLPAYDLFEQISDFIETMSREQHMSMYASYVDIRRLFDYEYDLSQLSFKLRSAVVKLLDHIDLQKLEYFLISQGKIRIPDSIHQTWDGVGKEAARVKTYIRSDYTALVAMTAALRLMIPVWGEYIFRVKENVSNATKEYHAFNLIEGSQLMASEAMQKFAAYVECSIPTDRDIATAIMSGISSEDFPRWVLAIVTLRRLTVGDIRGVEKGNGVKDFSLITFVYTYISFKVKGMDSSLAGKITYKGTTNQNQDEENNISALEEYRVKQVTPAGIIAMFEVYVRDNKQVLNHLCPGINLEMPVNAELFQKHHERDLNESQMVLVKWIFSLVMPPGSIDHLDKPTVINCYLIAQAFLMHHGLVSLACLSTAIAKRHDGIIHTTSIDGKMRTPKEVDDRLKEMFPHERRSQSKQKNARKENPALDAITKLADDLSSESWLLTVRDELVPIVNHNNLSRTYVAPDDIKVQLSKLVMIIQDIKLNRVQEKF